MDKLKVIVTGSRFFNERATVYRTLDKYIDFFFEPGVNISLINGGSKGVEDLARQYSVDNNLELKNIFADFNKSKNKSDAFKLRNETMVKESDVLLAFLDKNDRDTKFLIDTALRNGLEVHVVPIEVEMKKEFKPKDQKGKKEFSPKEEYKDKKDFKQKKGFKNDNQKRR